MTQRAESTFLRETEAVEWLKKRLYIKSRSLALALGLLELQFTEETGSMGSDGEILYVSAGWLREQFADSAEELCELLLHVLCHCMLGHPFRFRSLECRGEKADEEAWEEEAWKLTDEILGRNERQARAAGKRRREEHWYGADDHGLWRRKSGEIRKISASGDGGNKGKSWQQAARALRSSAGGRKAGRGSMSVVKSLTLTSEKRYDYRAFLKSFSCLREEGGPDMEQFDYGFYFWGLEQYGNIPLIEPPEYREKRKIEDLVIVIDTSGSCSENLVRCFLEETRNILQEDDLFFRRFRLHILQCDNRVQRDDRITCQEELDGYLEELYIKGGGGTDFRPAFQRIEELRAAELPRLKGVLYFTDGCGIYPGQMTDYVTAFIFLKYRYEDIDVPDWAVKLVLDADRPKGAEG